MKTKPTMIETIQRRLGEFPVEDATVATQLFVQPIDIKNGIPENPDACAIAQCAKRAIGTDLAVIYKTRAWIKVPAGDGFKIIRYSVSDRDQAKIVAFDNTGVMPAGGVTLSPPTPSQTLAGKARQNELDHARYRNRSKDPATGKPYPNTGSKSPVNTRGHRSKLRSTAA